MAPDQDNEYQIDFTAFIQELELDKLSREDQEAVFSDVLESLNMSVLTRIMNSMTEEQRAEMRTMADVDPENIFTAVLNTIPKEQQAQMFQEELEIIKEEMKADMAGEGQSQE